MGRTTTLLRASTLPPQAQAVLTRRIAALSKEKAIEPVTAGEPTA